MRIGFDARTIVGETGIAQYGRNLFRCLPMVDTDDEFVSIEKNKTGMDFLSSQIGFQFKLSRAKVDLLHVPGGAPPVFYKRPFVLTVHDLAIYRHPEWFPDGQWFSTRFAYPRAVSAAAHIIAPSTSTKNDLIEIFKIKGEKITVIPHGVIFPTLLSKERVGVRYVLFLGTIEPRKNISTLVRAYKKMVDADPELRSVGLVIAGSVGWKCDEIIDEIRKTQCEGYSISLRGRVSEKEKWQLLSAASCLAVPSHYEGFGMQTLEAMAAGAPVLCSNVSALPEAVGGAGLLLPPGDIAAWSAGLAEVLKNKKFADELRAKGLARAKAMSWEKAAAATVDVYRRVSL